MAKAIDQIMVLNNTSVSIAQVQAQWGSGGQGVDLHGSCLEAPGKESAPRTLKSGQKSVLCSYRTEHPFSWWQ